MLIACGDLSEQMEQAVSEGVQKIRVSGYSDDLIQCLEKEKGSVEELMGYVNSLAAGLQDHLEEMQRERESLRMAEDAMEGTRGSVNQGEEYKQQDMDDEGTEEEDRFEDAKETGSINSNTSKTQVAAEDSQTGSAKSAVPQPLAGEGGHRVHAAVGHGNG